MQFSYKAGAAVLLALAQTVVGGSVSINNNCGYQVYYASVASGGADNMQPLPAGFSQSMQGSVSIKIAPQMSGPVTQLEYTMTGNMLNYDMSNINGYPFADGGMVLSPSSGPSSDFPTCVAVNCPAGDSVCAAAYNQPDDTRTLVCGTSTSLTLTLCPNGPSKREVSSVNVHRMHPRHLPKLA